MGLYKSKPTLKSIRTEVEQIRGNLKGGYIAIHEKERYENTLKLSIREIKKSKYRVSKRRSLHILINNTLHDLSVKKIKYQTKKNVNSFQEMRDELVKMRALIKKKVLNLQCYERLQRTLAFYDKKVDGFSFEVSPKEIKSVHKEINVINEQITQKKASIQLDDIEERLDILKDRIKRSEMNNKAERINLIEHSLQTLAIDLGVITAKDIFNEQRKDGLEKKALRLNEKLNKIRKQPNGQDDVDSQKRLEVLEEIEEEINLFNINLNETNFNRSKPSFDNFKKRLDAVEDIDQKVVLKKGEVSDALLVAENTCTQFKMADKLKQAENIFENLEKQLDQSVDASQSESYIPEFNQLQEYVDQILEVNQDVSQRKKQLTQNIKACVETVKHEHERDFTPELIREVKHEKPVQEKIENNNASKLETETIINRNNDDSEQTFAAIEKALEKLRPKIESFNGLISSSEYFELDDTLMEHTLQLDKMKFDTHSDQHHKKVHLLREIKVLNTALDLKAEEAEKEVKTFEAETEDINKMEENETENTEIPQFTEGHHDEKIKEDVDETSNSTSSSNDHVLENLRKLDEVEKSSDQIETTCRIEQFKEMEKLEKQLDKMVEKVDSFNGELGGEEHSLLCKEVEELALNLGNIEMCLELKTRRDICAKKIIDCVTKLDIF